MRLIFAPFVSDPTVKDAVIRLENPHRWKVPLLLNSLCVPKRNLKRLKKYFYEISERQEFLGLEGIKLNSRSLSLHSDQKPSVFQPSTAQVVGSLIKLNKNGCLDDPACS